MKKFLVITVALILVFALFECGRDKTTSTEQDTGTAETYETDSEESEPADVSEDPDTGDESSESAVFHYHRLTAFLADEIGLVFLKLYLDILHFFLGFFQSLVEISVKIRQKLYPFIFAVFNSIKILLHLSCEFDICNLREAFFHQLCGYLSEFCRNKCLALTLYIAS